MVVLGVDPGQNGAYVSLTQDGKIHQKGTFSLTKGGDIDFKGYIEAIRALDPKPTVAYLEEVHAIYRSSAASTFSFGRSYQLAIDGLVANDIEIKYVPPKAWQKEVVTSPIKHKWGGQKDIKAMALASAQEHFVGEGFLKTPRSRVPHDGLVDASLIALYGLKKEASN